MIVFRRIMWVCLWFFVGVAVTMMVQHLFAVKSDAAKSDADKEAVGVVSDWMPTSVTQPYNIPGNISARTILPRTMVVGDSGRAKLVIRNDGVGFIPGPKPPTIDVSLKPPGKACTASRVLWTHQDLPKVGHANDFVFDITAEQPGVCVAEFSAVLSQFKTTIFAGGSVQILDRWTLNQQHDLIIAWISFAGLIGGALITGVVTIIVAYMKRPRSSAVENHRA